MAENEVQGEWTVPDGWVQATIGEIADQINSGFPSGKHNTEGIGVPHLRPMNISPNGEIDLSLVKYVEVSGYDALREGDVLFNNTNSPAWLGKTAYIKRDTNWAYSNHMTRIRLHHGFDSGWVACALHHLFLTGFFRMNCRHHVNQASINTNFLSTQTAIPVPPLSEQRRIVAEIETQFTRLDAGVAALERTQANLRRYRAAVLKTACEGRLVATEAEFARAEGRDYEPVDQLLTRILAERRARWEAERWKYEIERAKKKAAQAERKAAGLPARIRDLIDEDWQDLPEEIYFDYLPRNDRWKQKYKEPAQPDMENLPDDLPGLPKLPDGWAWVNLNQLTWSVKDGPHYSPPYVSEGIPFITGGNVRPDGVDFSDVKYISLELHAELSKRCKPEKGDILYTKGGTTGIARVNTYDIEFNVWVHVAVLKLVDPIAPFYVQHTLNSPLCYAQAQKYTHGVGNQDLGLTRMINIVLALPPLVEQHRIVAEVERRLSVVAALEREVEAALARAVRLRQAVLKQAFEGRLVDQDPDDEPAAALLERIRAAREAQANGGKKRKTRRMRLPEM